MIQLPSNKKKLFLVSLGTVCVCVIVGLRFATHHTIVETTYHTSLWNNFAPQVDVEYKKGIDKEITDLSHVYGMVVPHHIPTTIPKLVEYYSQLKKHQTVKNFIVIGPDHIGGGRSPISTSATSFYTTYGQVAPIPGLAKKLQESGVVHIDESPFDQEHSIGAQVLLISKIFPESHITPLILRSDVSVRDAEIVGDVLTDYLDEDTVLVASVDFSHYLSTEQATPIDAVSHSIVSNLDADSYKLITADSKKSMLIFMTALGNKQAKKGEQVQVLNTNDFMQNTDYTTGYVFGFFGK